ncbi:MAG: cell division protein ZapA [Proteobacteria bacterium]|nr:cell division protein ZapA [Pseudomonadota bacterium]
MASVSVSINSRNYRMACEDGQEPHLIALAADLEERIARLRAGFGEIGDMRLTVMAALMLADELSDAIAKVQSHEEELGRLRAAGSQAGDSKAATEVAVTQALNIAAERIEKIVRTLNQSTGAAPLTAG